MPRKLTRLVSKYPNQVRLKYKHMIFSIVDLSNEGEGPFEAAMVFNNMVEVINEYNSEDTARSGILNYISKIEDVPEPVMPKGKHV